MPKEIDAFQCPLCDSMYESEEECRDCLTSCAAEADVEAFAWKCQKCGKLFWYESAAEKHERYCTVMPKEQPGEESCPTCAHSDAEEHRWPPCPDVHFSPIRPACEHYARAEK